MQIGIIPNAKDLRKMYSSLKAVKRKAFIAAEDLPFKCAIDFRDLLIRNITSQKYSSGYPKYSKEYAKWKSETARAGNKFWVLGGDLLRSLSFFKVKDGWMSGIPPGVRDSGGKSMYGKGGRPVLISVYGRFMELGRRGQEPRELFKPTTNEYAKGPWQKRGRESLKIIARGWK